MALHDATTQSGASPRVRANRCGWCLRRFLEDDTRVENYSTRVFLAPPEVQRWWRDNPWAQVHPHCFQDMESWLPHRSPEPERVQEVLGDRTGERADAVQDVLGSDREGTIYERRTFTESMTISQEYLTDGTSLDVQRMRMLGRMQQNINREAGAANYLCDWLTRQTRITQNPANATETITISVQANPRT